ncbi:MAG: hypothetical protein BalsKO_18430 [Balneolaceae bacterium]
MRLIALLSVTLSLLSCSTVDISTKQDAQPQTISLSISDNPIISKTPWFSKELAVELLEASFAETLGENILQDVLVAYESQLPELVFVENQESDLKFQINSITVKRGLFTLNLAHPGPLYKMKMEASVIRNGLVIKKLSSSELVNMSQINFANHSTKWMTKEEKLNKEYQKKTFTAGLRKMYQKLYFNYFDISLQL